MWAVCKANPVDVAMGPGSLCKGQSSLGSNNSLIAENNCISPEFKAYQKYKLILQYIYLEWETIFPLRTVDLQNNSFNLLNSLKSRIKSIKTTIALVSWTIELSESLLMPSFTLQENSFYECRKKGSNWLASTSGPLVSQ